MLFSLFNNALSKRSNDELQVPSIEALYNALESVIWGDKYPKNGRVTFGDMKIPEDISEEVIKKISQLYND